MIRRSHTLLTAAALGVLAVVPADAAAQQIVVNPQPGRGPGIAVDARPGGSLLRGRILRTYPNENRFAIAGPDGGEVIVYGEPRTTYRFGGRSVTFGDLREGADINVGYTLRGGRYYATTVYDTMADVPPGRLRRPDTRVIIGGGGALAVAGETYRGRLAADPRDPNRLTLTTADGRVFVLTLDDRADASVTAVDRGNGRVEVAAISLAATVTKMDPRDARDDRPAMRDDPRRSAAASDRDLAAAAAAPARVRVVRIDRDRIVVRSDRGEDMTLPFDDRTVFRMGARDARLSDLREGADVSVVIDAAGGARVIRSVTWDTAPDPREPAAREPEPARNDPPPTPPRPSDPVPPPP